MVADWHEPDRPRGVLSSADREYLIASDKEREESYSRQARTKRKNAIQERTKNAIRDFSLLYHYLDEEDRAGIFSEDLLSVNRGIYGMLSFLWQRASDSPPYTEGESLIASPEETLRQWLERGIYQAQTANEPMVDGPAISIQPVSVDLEVQSLEEISIRKINEKVREKGVEALSEYELQFLLWLGRREQVADMKFTSIEFEEVLAEFTDRLDYDWKLRDQFILSHGAYADDAEMAKRAERREQFRESTSSSDGDG